MMFQLSDSIFIYKYRYLSKYAVVLSSGEVNMKLVQIYMYVDGVPYISYISHTF